MTFRKLSSSHEPPPKKPPVIRFQILRLKIQAMRTRQKILMSPRIFGLKTILREAIMPLESPTPQIKFNPRGNKRFFEFLILSPHRISDGFGIPRIIQVAPTERSDQIEFNSIGHTRLATMEAALPSKLEWGCSLSVP